MTDQLTISEQGAAPSLKWTVRNKIRRFVESGMHLIASRSGAMRGGRETPPDDRPALFSLYAPEAVCVSLAGDFNAWNPDDCPLEKSPEGTWERAVVLPAGRHEYKFVVDGHWQDDPRCAERAPNPFGGENCVVILS
jgi:1,4-alpha-glucan branching enzyme